MGKHRADKLFQQQAECGQVANWEYREMKFEDYNAIKSTMAEYEHVYDHKLKGVWIREKPRPELSEKGSPIAFVLGVSMVGLALWGMAKITENARKEMRRHER